MRQYNIIMNVLGGWCRDLEVKLKELVGSKSKGVLHSMQKAVLSGTLNISRTFKVATCTMNIAFAFINFLLQHLGLLKL